jgi:tetratricopeptide (TPR) repeat protein
MPDDTIKDPRRNFVPRFLPWLLGAAFFIFYRLTLNHWLSVSNIGAVGQLSGLSWQPQIYNPVTFLATLPARWLSPAGVPLAMNMFAAACAALSLALLARCVAILPHDRTETERQREKSDFAFLTGWVAWVPPVFAVLVCGLQLTMWQHATNYTGESFALVLFAAIVWQILEFRLDEKDGRLYFAAFLLGAGIIDNWAMISFVPMFFAAVIWLKGLQFFRAQFLTGLFGTGFLGLMFLLVLPLMSRMTASYPLGFWDSIKPTLVILWRVIKVSKESFMLHNFSHLLLTVLLPVLLMSLRWSASFGDSSRIGTALVNLMIHVVYGAVFTVSVWVCFNPPFSPDHLMSAPSLPLFFLAAMVCGFFSGYFLLVFSRKPVPSRRHEVQQPLPDGVLWLCPVIVVFTFIAMALTVTTLIYRNRPVIRLQNGDALFRYADLATRNLPSGGAILLCDSDDPSRDVPLRALLVDAMLVHQGRQKNYAVVDTQSLMWLPYQRYLHRHFPEKFPLVGDEKNIGAVPPLTIYNLLGQLAKSNAICYLNPSYGFYFEQFYQEPHGLSYLLKPLPEDTLLHPPFSQEMVALNEQFWAEAGAEFARVQHSRQIVDNNEQNYMVYPSGLLGWLLMHLHAKPEPDVSALQVGQYYSRALNTWGVSQQRAGDLDAAAKHFSNAITANPDNIAAAINLKFNAALRAGSNSVTISPVTADQFGKYRGWNEVLNANGPFDETSFAFENGWLLMQAGQLKQAVEPFTRVRQLAPDNLAARLFLGQIYIFAKQPDRAMEALHEPLTQPARFSLNESNSAEVNILAASAHFQKNQNDQAVALMDREVDRHPGDDTLLQATGQAYYMRGLYTNALSIIERKLARSPDELQWIFNKGLVTLSMKRYDDAIAAMTRVMAIATNDPTPRLNRAIAYLQSDRLPEARADYATLQTTYTNNFQVAYGLAEIAWRTHDTNEAVRNYNLYLANAATNTAEAATVRERLAAWKR